MIKTVVFDLGGVLIDHDPRYLYRKLIPEEAEMTAFLTDVCHHDWNEMQDAGRPLSEATAERVALFPEQAELIEAYYGRWVEMLDGAVDGSVEILAELKGSGTPLYALTNFSAETFEIAKPLYDFLDWFDGILVSGEEKLIKPDPRIYALLLDRYGLNAEGSVFIDDRADNVKAARDMGFHAIQFRGAEVLRRDLSAAGVI